MIRRCSAGDNGRIFYIINEAAKAYEGAIPADCYHQPYMPQEELEHEMKRVTFFGEEISNKVVGVMGIEPVNDVTLIRHAYVLPDCQREGIGSRLLNHLKSLTKTPRLLVGTWADATWAVDFYIKHGFSFLPDTGKVLKTYWVISQRQIDTSVVLGIEVSRAGE